MSKLGKRVTKLTTKAAQALAEGANKLKRKASHNSTTIKTSKKVKGTTLETSSSSESSSQSSSPTPTFPSSHKATVHTEEDEDAFNTIVINDSDSDTSRDGKNIDDGESSEAELGSSIY
ncbi:hypothetical protein P692DRAFT_20822993 [Suillus brevipes Sb2]|nr:hypothetical protein P692DRAFT_20822993 [Suillus brevipes Sb2]